MAVEFQQDGQGRVTAAKLADVLSQVGPLVTESDILVDVQAGAPVESDGRVPMLDYFGWLYNQMVNGVS